MAFLRLEIAFRIKEGKNVTTNVENCWINTNAIERVHIRKGEDGAKKVFLITLATDANGDNFEYEVLTPPAEVKRQFDHFKLLPEMPETTK
jgi:hypothetical protein